MVDIVVVSSRKFPYQCWIISFVISYSDGIGARVDSILRSDEISLTSIINSKENPDFFAIFVFSNLSVLKAYPLCKSYRDMSTPMLGHHFESGAAVCLHPVFVYYVGRPCHQPTAQCSPSG